MPALTPIKKNEVLAVIVTYNAMQWYAKCVASLLSSSFPVDIVVIDNLSTDETVQFSRKTFPEVYLIENSNNAGFGAANNIGLEHALKYGYDYAFLLNQDAWIKKDTIEKLVKASKKKSEYGIISPIHLNGLGSSIDHLLFKNIIAHASARTLFSDLYLQQNQGKIYDLTYVNAACWLMTVSCIRRVGLFDPIFQHYGEDNNYCHRAEYHKFKIGIITDTCIYHDREDRVGKKPKWKGNVDLDLRLKLGNVIHDYASSLSTQRKVFLKDAMKAIISLKPGKLKSSINGFFHLAKISRSIKESHYKNRLPLQ